MRSEKVPLGVYLLAFIATLFFTYISLEFPQILIQFRYSSIWRTAYANGTLIGILLLLTLYYFYYNLKNKHYTRSTLGSTLYFMPTFMIYLMGMAYKYTGIEVISYTIYNILYTLGSEGVFFHTFLTAIYYIGEFFYLPYWLYIFLNWSGKDWYAIYPLRDQYGTFFIVLGAFVMFLGIACWIEGKRKNHDLVTNGIYRFVRHPQYLGFILWGYGVLVCSTHRQAPFQHPLMPTFNWVLSSLMLVGLALTEEIELRQTFSEYNDYAEKVSFFVPVPRILRRILAKPWKTLWKGDYPSTLRMVFVTFSVLFFLLLLPGLLFGLLYDYEGFRQYAKIIDLSN